MIITTIITVFIWQRRIHIPPFPRLTAQHEPTPALSDVWVNVRCHDAIPPAPPRHLIRLLHRSACRVCRRQQWDASHVRHYARSTNAACKQRLEPARLEFAMSPTYFSSILWTAFQSLSLLVHVLALFVVLFVIAVFLWHRYALFECSSDWLRYSAKHTACVQPVGSQCQYPQGCDGVISSRAISSLFLINW